MWFLKSPWCPPLTLKTKTKPVDKIQGYYIHMLMTFNLVLLTRQYFLGIMGIFLTQKCRSQSDYAFFPSNM